MYLAMVKGITESPKVVYVSTIPFSLSVQDVPENNFCNQAGVLAKRFFSGTPCIFILYVSDVIPGGFRQKLIMSFILDQVTAVFPYIILIIFFVRAMGLRGMEDGVRHLFTPKVTFP